MAVNFCRLDGSKDRRKDGSTRYNQQSRQSLLNRKSDTGGLAGWLAGWLAGIQSSPIWYCDSPVPLLLIPNWKISSLYTIPFTHVGKDKGEQMNAFAEAQRGYRN